jgi:Lrp/AsnC family leucine-responsive transcriptional regulator
MDITDKKILNMLLQSGRVSYTDIAKAVDMKPPSIIDRIKKMESEGIIKGYTALVDYQKLGYDLNAFIGIAVENHKHVSILEKSFSDVDDSIIGCYHVTGEFTLMLRIITKNTQTLAELIKKLRAINGVTKTNTILIFSTLLEHMRDI